VSPVIDAHHHLLDPARFDYPWLTPELSAIDRRFGPDDLAPELMAAGIERTILVQTISSVEETRDLLATAARVPFIGGVVGWVDLTDRGVGDTLDALRGGPAGEWLVGIRHQVHDESDPDWLLRPDVRRGLAAIDASGLAYDLLVRSRELPAALVVARDMPGLRFIVDHMAKPPIRTGATEPWASLVRPFGELPNVWCKLSGLVTEADPVTWGVADLAPFVEIALETFGPGRLLFGSDWPVCLLAASYADVVGAARELTAGLSIAERTAVFGGAAAAVYRLSVSMDRVG
jgi:L-fucono-1,5-lactonase